jgi:tetratricopeptide (TPR) repeat protein
MPQIIYSQERLEIIAPNIDDFRELNPNDHNQFDSWIASYANAIQSNEPETALLSIGREIYDWLNASYPFFDRMMDEMDQPPYIIEFIIPRRPDNNALRFLEVPWELIADKNGFLAGDTYTMFCPIRRIGNKQNTPEPSPYRLSAVFMAASPEGVGHLRFEDEESAILDAVQGMGMDLTVEESGNLDLLANCMAEQEQVDVLHISCHGQLQTQPLLILETEEGMRDPVPTETFARRLGSNRPRLLFLSACTTSEPMQNKNDADLHHQYVSYASAMIRSGMPAVIGWSGSVRDVEATRFANKLYDYLSHSESIESAVALSRLALLTPDDPKEKTARDWHLARLYLGSTGGNVLSKGKQARRLRDRDAGHKEFLNAKDQQIPVAGRHEFVGRRRQIQRILKTFRSDTQSKAGILIHGFGRQGKSSLAARIAHRLRAHKAVIIYKYYDAARMLKAFSEFLGTKEIQTIVDNHLPAIRESGKHLEPALMELLNGPCKGHDDTAPPVLFVIDDFERALESPGQNNLHTVKSENIESIQAVIRAFSNAESRSCLLFTSRYQFTLPSQGKDLAHRLESIQLPPMQPHESQKQAEAKAKGLDKTENEITAPDIQKCIAASMGNPGLQDLLFSLSVEAKDAFDNAVNQILEYANSGQFPTVEKLLSFMENLIIDDLLKVLTKDEKELVRASTLFSIPIPIGSLEVFADKCGFKTTSPFGTRLFSLGIWEQFESIYQAKEKTVALNALVRPKAGQLSEAEKIHLAQQIITDLYERMGGADSQKRTDAADYELARLAILAKNTDVLVATAKDAIVGLENQFFYKKAADLSVNAIRILEKAQNEVPTWLYLNANQVCETVGNVGQAKYFVEKAIKSLRSKQVKKNGISNFDMASALLRHGRLLVNSGEPDKALEVFEEAKELFQSESYLKDQAIIAGEIARIKVSRGEVDEALRLHQEMLRVFEELGDQRSRAVTLGDIARIKVDRGEVDEALRLHQERLRVFEELGDQRERAVTLGDIARIKVSRGEVDEALRLHQEELNVYEELGDQRSRAVTLGYIARIKVDRGEVDEALRLHQERLRVFEELGDQRERAVTLGDIARIKVSRSEVDEALRLHQERLRVFEELGDIDEKANTLWGIAQIEMQRNEYENALELLLESYKINMELSRLDGICFVGLNLGQLLCHFNQTEQGLAILKRSKEGFIQLQQPQMARQVDDMIMKIQQ